MISVNKIKQIKPEWGNLEQIQLVRHYSDLRNGLKPLTNGDDWGRDEDAEEFEMGSYVHAAFICPVCFNPHTVYLEEDNGITDENEFVLDSNYCATCQTEFCFHDESEFELYVNPDQP